MDVRELRPGLWRWTAPHPEWTPEEGGPDGWEQEVASYALVQRDGLVLFDPLAPPTGTPDADRFWRRLDEDVERHGPPAILVTVFWHARSSQEILDRYPGAAVWADERAVGELGKRVRATDTFRVGEPLPGGVTAHEGGRGGEVLFWLPSHRALVAGDVLLGADGSGARICPESWLRPRTREDVRAALRPLLDLPVELLLLTHGEPVEHDAHGALERALAS